jgi:hypothetical protein
MIKNFPLLMEEPTDGADEEALVYPTLRVPIASFKEKSLEWTIKCWPNIAGKGMRLLIRLGRAQPSDCPQMVSRLQRWAK